MVITISIVSQNVQNTHLMYSLWHSGVCKCCIYAVVPLKWENISHWISGCILYSLVCRLQRLVNYKVHWLLWILQQIHFRIKVVCTCAWQENSIRYLLRWFLQLLFLKNLKSFCINKVEIIRILAFTRNCGKWTKCAWFLLYQHSELPY